MGPKADVSFQLVRLLIYEGIDLCLCLRSIPGPPLTKDSLISLLIKANVTVGVGVVEAWEARNARFDIAWVRNFRYIAGFEFTDVCWVLQAALESGGDIQKHAALALGTTNLQKSVPLTTGLASLLT